MGHDMTQLAPWGPLTTVVVGDPKTWRIATDQLPGGYRVMTSFHALRFAPAWTVAGEPHHFETLVSTPVDATYFRDDQPTVQTYATEAAAREGHAALVERLRASLGGAL